MEYGLNEIQDSIARQRMAILYYDQQAKEAKTELGRECAVAQMMRFEKWENKMLAEFDKWVVQN